MEEIRRLTIDDAPAYRALRLRSFREHPEAFATSAEELEREASRPSRPHVLGIDLNTWN